MDGKTFFVSVVSQQGHCEDQTKAAQYDFILTIRQNGCLNSEIIIDEDNSAFGTDEYAANVQVLGNEQILAW